MTVGEFNKQVEVITKELTSYVGMKIYKDLYDEVVSRYFYEILISDIKVVTDVSARGLVRKLIKDILEYATEEYDPIVLPDILQESHDFTLVSQVMEILGPDKIQLFCIYYLEQSDIALEIVDEFTKVLFKICERLCTQHNYDKTVTAHSENLDEISAFLAMSKLIEVDQKLLLLPAIIGEQNFAKLVSCMSGLTLTFPTKGQLAEISEYVGVANKELREEHIADTVESSTLQLMSSVVKSPLYRGLKDFTLTDTQAQSFELVTLVAYLQNVFNRHRPIHRSLELTENASPKQKIDHYRLQVQETQAQSIFLTKMLEIFKSFENTTPTHPAQNGFFGQETETP